MIASFFSIIYHYMIVMWTYIHLKVLIIDLFVHTGHEDYKIHSPRSV